MERNVVSVEEKDRVVVLDILRGLAILGIFLVNMPDFHSPFLYINPLDWWSENPDHILYIMTDLVAQASFYPLFAFLFGYGAVILADRTAARGGSFSIVFSRRLVFLLLIGIFHAFFIWHGDILITYALIGFLFLLVYKWKGRNLLITGALLHAIPIVMLSLLLVLLVIISPETSNIPTDPALTTKLLHTYQQGTFVEITAQRFEDWYAVNNLYSAPLLFLSIFPLFLIGAGFAKLKWLEQSTLHQRKLLVMAAGFGVVGVLLKVLPYVSSYQIASVFIQDQIGGPLLSLFYITVVTLLLKNKTILRLLSPFASVGRLSMSQYLLQSIVCTLLFYGYGLGLYGKISFTVGVIIVFLIYGLQLIVSKIWLTYNRYGPVEYLWRYATYGKRPLMRKKIKDY